MIYACLPVNHTQCLTQQPLARLDLKTSNPGYKGAFTTSDDLNAIVSDESVYGCGESCWCERDQRWCLLCRMDVLDFGAGWVCVGDV